MGELTVEDLMAERKLPHATGPVRSLAVVCSGVSGGGAERATRIWAKRMTLRKVRVVWIHTRELGAMSAECGDVCFVRIPAAGESRQRELAAVLAAHAVDACLFVDHSLLVTMFDIAEANRRCCRIVVAEHNGFFYPMDEGVLDVYSVREPVYRLADVVTALSPENVGWWKAAGIGHVTYMPNYLTFEPGETPPVRNPTHVLLTAGRICDRKGGLLAVRTVAELVRRPGFSDVRLVMMGRFDDADYERRMREEVDRLGVRENVAFVGEVADVAPYFDQAGLHLMLSRMEGAPMVIFEARAHGLPTVMFDIPYVANLREEDGVVTAPYGDVAALADAIAGVLSDTARYGALSRASFARLQDFSAAAIDRRWDKVFDYLEGRTPTLDPQCETVPPDVLLDVALKTLSRCALSGDRRCGTRVRLERARFDELMLKHRDLCTAYDRLELEYERTLSSRAFRLGRLLLRPFGK